MNEFEHIWSLLPHPEGSVVRWFARSGERRTGDFAESAEQLRLAAESLPGWNVYIAPNPTNQRLGDRHKAEDVTHWSYFFLDIDPVEETSDPAAMLEDCLTWLGEWLGSDFQNRRPLTIDSGRGYQAWVRLDDILLANSVDAPGGGMLRHDARIANSYWLKRLDNFLGTKHGCKLDTTCSDLPRVMRCPGTVNQKTGRMARILCDGDIRKGFASKMITGTPKKEFVIPDPVVLPPGTPWQMVFQSLTNKARTFLLSGWEEPGRHDAAWHTAKQLCERGISIEEARKALYHGNEMCLPEPLAPDVIERQLRTGFGA